MRKEIKQLIEVASTHRWSIRIDSTINIKNNIEYICPIGKDFPKITYTYVHVDGSGLLMFNEEERKNVKELIKSHKNGKYKDIYALEKLDLYLNSPSNDCWTYDR